MADRIERLSLDYEVLTPLFLGDADQAHAELRPPSLKGLLRFWYRAVDPDHAQREGRWFGDTQDHGQAPFLLRARAEPSEPWRWDNNRAANFDEGQGKETRNGLRYLGYPFDPRFRKEREALPPNSRFILELVFHRKAEPEQRRDQRRAVLAAAWLLGHLGGAGSRSRRGFGSLALLDWQGLRSEEQEALPLLVEAANREAWLRDYEGARRTFEEWFGAFPATAESPPHPHLGGKTQVWLGTAEGRFPLMVLNGMGRRLQDFRLRRAPDYQRVKDHLTGVRRLEQAPERAAFGLPLTFRYSSVGGRSITFSPYDQKQKTTRERHGSLLHLRVVRLADGLHPLFLRLDGAVPGEGQEAQVAPRNEGRPLYAADGNLLDRFMTHLSEGR